MYLNINKHHLLSLLNKAYNCFTNNKMTRFSSKKNYLHLFILLFFLWIGQKILFSYIENDTSTIIVSLDYSNLTCNSKITIQDINNVDDLDHTNYSLESEICTLNHIKNMRSPKNRAYLVYFSKHILESPLINRHDIAQYFYRIIINEDPNDALSLYLKKYELTEKPV